MYRRIIERSSRGNRDGKGLMKKLLLILSGAVVVSAGTFIQEVPSNRALVASPRAREEFPELLRTGVTRSRQVKVESFAAFAQSMPRVHEQFPQLDRSFPTKRGEERVGKSTERGIAANPRALEENPALARKVHLGRRFQIAPLK